MTRSKYQAGSRAPGARICGVVLAGVLWLSMGADRALAETQSVIDPIEAREPPTPPAAATRNPPQPDARLRHERQRAEQEQRKRAKAEARALAAENEAAKLRAIEQAREAAAKGGGSQGSGSQGGCGEGSGTKSRSG